MFKILILSTILVSCVIALPSPDTESFDTKVVKKECAKGVLNSVCLKVGAITLLQKLNRRSELTLAPGVTLVKDIEGKADAAAELIKALPSDPEERLDKYLFYNLENFLGTHSVRLKLIDESSVEEARSMMNEGRGKDDPLGMGGKKGGMGGMMAMAMMMKGTLMSMGLGGLAMIAGKALMTAMMSLVLSAVIGIKSLSSGGKSTTYEIVSKPIYTHSHSHSTAHEDVGGGYGHSGYGRNLNVRRR